MTIEIILGSPGCGKTTALLENVELELASGTPPEKIGFVSFTKQATEEAISRACTRFGFVREQLPWFRTLHSMCFQWLGMRRGDVLEGRKLLEFAKWAGIRISTKGYSEDGTLIGFTEGDRALFIENLARVRRRSLREEYEADMATGSAGLTWTECKRVALCLEQYKRERGLYDFTDMLTMFVNAAPRLGLQVLFGDEAQDNSKLQWEVFRQAAQGCRRVVVAGDDDQAIYSPWAGADVAEFIGLPGDPRVLGQSHRVPRHVQDVALSLIGRVSNRHAKKWAAREEPGEVSHVPYLHHADFSGESVLILARNSYILAEQVEPELRAQGIIWERNGKLSIDKAVLAAAQDWEALRAGRAVTPGAARALAAYTKAPPVDPGALERLEEAPEVTLPDLRAALPALGTGPWYEALDRIPAALAEYIRAARARGEQLNKRPRVRVSTIHAAKGAEADDVVLMTEMAPRSYRDMERSPDDEARVWYVGATRARKRLTLVGSRSPNRYRL